MAGPVAACRARLTAGCRPNRTRFDPGVSDLPPWPAAVGCTGPGQLRGRPTPIMRKLSVLCLALAGAGLLGATEPLAVFGRHDIQLVAAESASRAGDQASFLAAYRRDRAATTPFELELPLVNPPDWGRTVSANAGGSVQYHRIFSHGFVCRIALHDLLPNHAYVLTLNGNPFRDGNALLPTPVPGNEAEKYYDFLDIKTDGSGRYDGELGIFLEPGRYDVRIYAKDASDFKIVLYRDFFPFVVQ